MSLGGNFSSGYTNKLQENNTYCAVPVVTLESCNPCKTKLPGPQPVAQYSSMALIGKLCPPPTPEEFAMYPKVAVASSVRTQSLMNQTKCDPSQRFSHFKRYTPPAPCPPLPPSMAGISQPSTRRCNL
jgi:hypothetical protein